MKREKRLTKKERKAQTAASNTDQQHIHCIACGRHLHAGEFTASPVTARYLSCQHGHKFPACTGCVAQGQQMLREHDRTGQPVQVAHAWH
jgi:hypothetical protein